MNATIKEYKRKKNECLNVLKTIESESELQGYLKGIDTAFNVWNYGTQTYGDLSEYKRIAKNKLKKIRDKAIKKIQEICDNINYVSDIPNEAIKIAKENNMIIIKGSSDGKMNCYGANCYLTKKQQHDYG